VLQDDPVAREAAVRYAERFHSSGLPGADTAAAEIVRKAEARVAAGQARTVPQGVAQVVTQEPALAARHWEEQSGFRPAGSAAAEIEGKARALVTKGVLKTHAQAVAKVVQEEPALYARHVAEQRGRGAR
jgi:hypothetical protein